VTAAAFLTCMLAAACSGSGGEDGGGANGGAAASADAAAGPVPDARGSGGGGSAQTDAARPPTPPGPDGAVAADASVAPPPEPDAVAVADAVVAPPPVPDAAVVADARGVPDAVAVPPDAAVVADARIVPDAVAIPPDAAVAPDAVAIPSDAAVAPDATVAPDAAVVSPDAAVVEPPPDPDAPLPDLMAIPERTRDDMYFEEREFAPDSCALFEGCVGGPGLRRLLRFGVSTANVGNVDFEMGDPRETPELFQFSPCHGHFHFNDYARYALKDADGNTIAPGHKQAFCLLDSAIFVDWDPTVRQFPRYGCQFQGISRGWYDSYGSGLDCQWIDVTDVPPGDYELEVRINPERAIAELDYTNNDLRMTVTVPSFEMDVPCGPADDAGPDRMCGWRIGAVGECAPGELVDAGCAQAGNDCADAVCPEQPFMRACAGEAASCMPRLALATGQNECGTCPTTTFRCPDVGRYTIWTAAPDPDLDATCDVLTQRRPEPPVDSRCPDGGASDGVDRPCGWQLAADGPVPCQPGLEYTAGCAIGPNGCGAGDACQGDPMLLVCPGATSCTQPDRLAVVDDSCGGLCPSVAFVCPPEGQVSLFAASYRAAEPSACSAGIVQRAR
jgi:hypothetical protein